MAERIEFRTLSPLSAEELYLCEIVEWGISGQTNKFVDEFRIAIEINKTTFGII